MRKVVIAALLLCLALPMNTFAQTSNATLGGTVADSAGALIPGVTVAARNVRTGIVNEMVTNETGTYQFSNLQTGTYEVMAELPGFQTQRFTNVVLGVAQQVRLNFTLTVAGRCHHGRSDCRGRHSPGHHLRIDRDRSCRTFKYGSCRWAIAM